MHILKLFRPPPAFHLEILLWRRQSKSRLNAPFALRRIPSIRQGGGIEKLLFEFLLLLEYAPEEKKAISWKERQQLPCFSKINRARAFPVPIITSIRISDFSSGKQFEKRETKSNFFPPPPPSHPPPPHSVQQRGFCDDGSIKPEFETPVISSGTRSKRPLSSEALTTRQPPISSGNSFSKRGREGGGTESSVLAWKWQHKGAGDAFWRVFTKMLIKGQLRSAREVFGIS